MIVKWTFHSLKCRQSPRIFLNNVQSAIVGNYHFPQASWGQRSSRAMRTAQPGNDTDQNKTKVQVVMAAHWKFIIDKKCTRNARISNFNMAYGIDAFSLLNRKCKVLILAVFGTILVGKSRFMWYIMLCICVTYIVFLSMSNMVLFFIFLSNLGRS